jgi:hypothetical protein
MRFETKLWLLMLLGMPVFYLSHVIPWWIGPALTMLLPIVVYIGDRQVEHEYNQIVKMLNSTPTEMTPGDTRK